MAAAFSQRVPEIIISAAKQNIDNFTHRFWVLNDLEKRMEATLFSTKYDIIILDFVDEKNDIGLIGGSVFTLSQEFSRAKVEDNLFTTIKSKSDRHFELWKTGLESFSRHVNQDRVFINKVYWSNSATDGTFFSKNWVSENNIFLEKLYCHAKKNYNFNFIDYDNNIFLADKNHKYGLSPYHYTHTYYENAKYYIDSIEKGLHLS